MGPKKFRNFSKKVIAKLKKRLKIHFLKEEDEVLKLFNNAYGLILFLSKADSTLKFYHQPRENIKVPDHIRKRLHWKDYFYFIHNIPTEFFRLRNPKKI